MGEPTKSRSLDETAAAIRQSVGGDLAVRAAVEMVLTTTLFEAVVPDYVDWVSEDTAEIAFDRMLTDADSGQGSVDLSGSGYALLTVAANLAQGARGAGAGVDLRRLWDLDDRNRRAVVVAVRDALLSQATFGHATTPRPAE